MARSRARLRRCLEGRGGSAVLRSPRRRAWCTGAAGRLVRRARRRLRCRTRAGRTPQEQHATDCRGDEEQHTAANPDVAQRNDEIVDKQRQIESPPGVRWRFGQGGAWRGLRAQCAGQGLQGGQHRWGQWFSGRWNCHRGWGRGDHAVCRRRGRRYDRRGNFRSGKRREGFGWKRRRHRRHDVHRHRRGRGGCWRVDGDRGRRDRRERRSHDRRVWIGGGRVG